MKIHEYQAKAILAKYGVPVPRGRMALTVDEAKAIAVELGGRVVVNGWRSTLDITPAEAIRQLEPFFGEFLYTHVDREGLMQGTDLDTIATLRAATTRRLTAAGGITTADEIRRLDALGVDAVVGMAIYTGRLDVRML